LGSYAAFFKNSASAYNSRIVVVCTDVKQPQPRLTRPRAKRFNSANGNMSTARF
jgi:hypothetical protein